MSVRKAILLPAIVFLLTGYCFVLYLIKNPNVTPEYRAYYIDRTTTISPNELKNFTSAKKYYRPGTLITHTGSASMLFEGWSADEERHRWSLGKRSEFIFYVDNAKSFEGKIALNCFYFRSQHITVDVNGKVVDSYVGTGEDASKTILFDPSLLKGNSLNSIGFAFPDAASPGMRDSRQLAMAFREVTVF